MAVMAMNRYFRKWDGAFAVWLHRALLGLTGLIKATLFCVGALVNVRWRRGCAIYRHILRWAATNSTDVLARG
jgi:hypothetical protein